MNENITWATILIESDFILVQFQMIYEDFFY